MSNFASSCNVSLGELERYFEGWSQDDLERFGADWQIWARDEQLAPPQTRHSEPWRTWIFLGGRGAGKTRSGAEWIKARALAAPDQRIALVGETNGDVANVMVAGQSGLLAIHCEQDRPRLETSHKRLVWPNGSIAQFFSAERPEGLRGPQFHAAWCDELVKWRHVDATWDMLQFGLRLEPSPQAVVTTTPRPLALLKQLLSDPATVVTRAATTANRANLAASFIAEIERRYAGTALGRQELNGEIIDDVSGAMWRRDWIEEQRCAEPPELSRIIVAVDPPVTAHAKSDACGIVVAGLGRDGRGYVLDDRTLQGRAPDVWARAAISAYEHYQADSLVVEVNQGGDLVVGVLRQISHAVAVRQVRATRGKWVRAEPVAALYAEGRIRHAGRFDELEQQLLTFGTDAAPTSKSPDRMDALVWAMTDLMLQPQAQPSLRRI